MPEEIQQEQGNRSTRSFEEWKTALMSLVSRQDPSRRVIIENEKVRPYYDQGLQPYVAFNELFNK